MDTRVATPSALRVRRQHLLAFVNAAVSRCVPENLRRDPDQARRATLIVHFGIQGAAFGTIYAVFYQLIGHVYGAAVIVVCSAIFAMVPYILRKTGALGFSGHLVVGTMAAGFTQLTLIEGGIHCHAVAWLASVPLCALLILGLRPALVWAAVCFVVGSIIGVAALRGAELEPLYDPKWRTLIDAAGNLGIILFMFTLGLLFETSRAAAFRRMEESLGELATSNDELAHLNNEKTEFLGIAAHDLRNPLSVVIGAADLITLEGDKAVQENAQLIAQSGRRMHELIKDLLDANAIEAGRYAECIEPHDLRALVVAGVRHNQIGAQRKRIVIEIVAGPPAWAQIDRRATEQVLDNLISNAVKYSPWDSNVRIHLRHADDWVEVAITDQGPGISAEDQKKLFRKHTRLSARPTGGESSIGLGLSIVKRLAEAMGGCVRCESHLGTGSTFIFRARTATNQSIAAITTQLNSYSALPDHGHSGVIPSSPTPP